jgi:hypothetical protein
VVLAPTVIADLVAFLEWWLYRRLVCLDGERCAIGMVLTVEPVEQKSGFERFDTDYSINLVLAPHTIHTDRDIIENDGVTGGLIAEQAATRDIGLPFAGYTSRQHQEDPQTPVLHGEFEGAGIYDLYQAAKAALVASTVGAAVCSIPVFGLVACIVIMAIAAAILIVGIIVALSDKGSPTDVNPDLTEIHTNDGGVGADILVIQGTWVYDSLHQGWNEIHPILHAQRIGTWQGFWGFDARQATDQWCNAIDDTSSPGTVEAQAEPAHQWKVHPLVDGCRPEPVID